MIPLLSDAEPADRCHHCGTELPPVRDAFCSECNETLDPSDEPVIATPPTTSEIHDRPSDTSILDDGPPRLWEDFASLFGYRDCFAYNRTGFLILVVSFLPVVVSSAILGEPPRGKGLVLTGVTACVFDFIVRSASADFHWLRPDSGGRILCFPVWSMGVFWISLGLRD